MRHDELRKLIHAYFAARLAKATDRLGADGPRSEYLRAPILATLSLAEASSVDYWEMTQPEGTDAFLTRFCEASGIPQCEVDNRPDRILQEYQIAHRDMLRALEKFEASFGRYDYEKSTPEPDDALVADEQVANSATLSQAITVYITENRRADSWQPGTFDKKEAALEALVELLGEDRMMTSITKADAQEVKRVLLELPANKNKNPHTRHLSLREATTVRDVTKLSSVTVNGYISIYQSFYDWAAKNGHAHVNLFEGMRVGRSNSRTTPQRQAFKPEALKAVQDELIHNTKGLVKSGSHKWATLIAVYSGARLNEVCQLDVSDLQQQDGTWIFNMMDEGEGNKRFKNAASIRKVPVHAELIRLGL
ncbi:hypothetical protein [Puniceibacterium confluentis]|uniref:hypothetical protein n=1 Tax=Puniceibacterium confluentis TaxID=1958944 RepID=UPI001647C715|nr:hypothetical protein [Puniceibacterium confluentis]